MVIARNGKNFPDFIWMTALKVGMLVVFSACEIGSDWNSKDTTASTDTSDAVLSKDIQGQADLSNQAYSQEAKDYFLEIAFGSEYGSGQQTIKKWETNIAIALTGSPTEEDKQTVTAVINELNQIISTIQLSLVSGSSDIIIYFVPESEFSSYEPNYQPTNYGFFWVNWDSHDVIYESTILISTTYVTQKGRSHLIREELTQSLGLMMDSYAYPDSIFYQGWTDGTSYSAIDRSIIEILYRQEITSGMTRAQVIDILNDW